MLHVVLCTNIAVAIVDSALGAVVCWGDSVGTITGLGFITCKTRWFIRALLVALRLSVGDGAVHDADYVAGG